MEGYCMKCKAKKEIVEGQEVVMKNGRSAMKGKCGSCGGGIYRILGIKKKEEAKSETAPAPEAKADNTDTPTGGDQSQTD